MDDRAAMDDSDANDPKPTLTTLAGYVIAGARSLTKASELVKRAVEHASVRGVVVAPLRNQRGDRIDHSGGGSVSGSGGVRLGNWIR